MPDNQIREWLHCLWPENGTAALDRVCIRQCGGTKKGTHLIQLEWKGNLIATYKVHDYLYGFCNRWSQKQMVGISCRKWGYLSDFGISVVKKGQFYTLQIELSFLVYLYFSIRFLTTSGVNLWFSSRGKPSQRTMPFGSMMMTWGMPLISKILSIVFLVSTP